MAVAQVVLYGVGLVSVSVGWGSEVRLPGFSQLSFFLLGNAAMCVATIKWLMGQRVRTWEPLR